MADYRDDPTRRDLGYDPDARTANAVWAWVASAVFLVVVLAIAFGVGHVPNQGNNTLASNISPPGMTHGAPNTLQPPPTASPLAPSPNSPATPTYTPSPRSTTQPQP